MIFGIISGTIWFFVFLVLKIGILHSHRIENKSRVILRLFMGSMVGCILSCVFLGKSMLEILIGLIVMLSFFILYMPFYYIIASSVSIQSLVLLSEKDSQSCPLDELKETFASTEIVSHKLRSMENSGLLLGNRVSNGGAYEVTTKGKFIADIFRSIKNIWNLGPGG